MFKAIMLAGLAVTGVVTALCGAFGYGDVGWLVFGFSLMALPIAGLMAEAACNDPK